MLRRPAALVLGAVFAALPALAGGAACSGGALKLCGEIPTGGCPAGRGGSCADRVCTGLYDCTEGQWVEVEQCSPAPGDAGAEARDAAAEADGACTPVTIDHQGEATGCTPDLQEPDCPAAAAEGCALSACLTGCVDFFLCSKTGWIDVAHCDEQGQIVVSP